MDLYKQIINTEKEAGKQILELKNSIYKYLKDVSGCGELKSVDIISNRKVSSPIITIRYDKYTFIYMDYEMVFSPKYTDELDFNNLYEVMKDMEYIIDQIIKQKEVK